MYLNTEWQEERFFKKKGRLFRDFVEFSFFRLTKDEKLVFMTLKLVLFRTGLIKIVY